MTKIRNTTVANLILWICLLLFFVVFPLSREILLCLNIVAVILTLTYTKLSIISLWSIITNYVIINLYFYDITGVGYGILGLTRINFVIMLQYMLILNYSLLFWGRCTFFLQREKKMLLSDIFVAEKTFTQICCIIAILASFVAFPTLPFIFNVENRFRALFPGNGWNHIALIALIVIIQNIKKYRFVMITYGVVVFWFLSHYERSDIIGLFLLQIVLYVSNGMKDRKCWRLLFKAIICIMMAFIVFTVLGEIRMSSEPISMLTILKKLITQNTASDIGYMYSISCDYVLEHGLLFGRTYIRYVLETIPMINTVNFNATELLGKYYAVPGGLFFLSEPLINFGFWGVVIIPNLQIALIYFMINKYSDYAYVSYLFLLATPFRYLWYGIGFIETGMIWLIPLTLTIKKHLKTRLK